MMSRARRTPSTVVRVCPTNTNNDWTKTKIQPRHWFTYTWLTNGRHAKLYTTLPMVSLSIFSASRLRRISGGRSGSVV
jgi:hypothetical protein